MCAGENCEGWHGPVTQRTRPVPVKSYGRLVISPQLSRCGGQQLELPFNRDGWTEIPIQRL